MLLSTAASSAPLRSPLDSAEPLRSSAPPLSHGGGIISAPLRALGGADTLLGSPSAPLHS